MEELHVFCDLCGVNISHCLIRQLEDRIARYEEMEKQYEILKKVIDYSVTVLEGALN